MGRLPQQPVLPLVLLPPPPLHLLDLLLNPLLKIEGRLLASLCC